MYLRKFNVLLFILSLVGAVIGCICGELLLNWGENVLPSIVLVGIYIGQLAMWICLFCLLAEIISPEINGQYWKKNNIKSGLKLVIPASLILLLIAGMLFQFIYGLTFNKVKVPNQFVILLDNSESMLQTDPNQASLEAVKLFIEQLDATKKAAIVLFNHEAYTLQPMVLVDNSQLKEEISDKLQQKEAPNGGTDFTLALSTALNEVGYSSLNTDSTQIILLSDGYSEVDLHTALQPIKDQNIMVSTIGMNVADFEGNKILKEIAKQTKGSFYLVDEISQVSNAINTIYLNTQNWHLVNERIGIYEDSVYYKIVRVVGFIAFGLLIGLALGMIFDNRYIAKSFMVGGTLSGLMAGLWIEAMFNNYIVGDWIIRLITACILAIILSLSTVIVPFKRVNDITLTSNMFSSRSKLNKQTGKYNNQHQF